MTELDFKYYSNIIFCGDLHDIKNLKYIMINYLYNIDNTLIIICGDIGIGFSSFIIESNILKDCNEILKEKNNYIILIRGNHDNPNFFILNSEYNQSNIKLIPDYTILNTKIYNILCVGGGISIDRTNRTINRTYWKNENVLPLNVYLTEQLSNLKYNIDIITTHNAPTYIKPINISIKEQGYLVENWSIYDKHLKEDVWNDRCELNKLYEFITKYHNIKYWIYGHFHDHYDSVYNNIKFIGLDMFYNFKKYVKKTDTYKLIKIGPDLYDINNPDKFNNVKYE